MSQINIKYLKEDATETLRKNGIKITNMIASNMNSRAWMKEELPSNPFEIKKFKIDDFELKTSKTGNYDEVDFENSITLYEHLKDLPEYVLTDERFWMWINLEKGYGAAIQAMEMKKDSKVFMSHWLFDEGDRRSSVFGVLSRCYFRVALTVDETLDDKYFYSRFAIEKPVRFRNLSWRTYSNNKDIVRSVLKAEMKALQETNIEKTSYYENIGKYVSQLGSVRFLDMIPSEELEDLVYKRLLNLINNEEN